MFFLEKGKLLRKYLEKKFLIKSKNVTSLMQQRGFDLYPIKPHGTVFCIKTCCLFLVRHIPGHLQDLNNSMQYSNATPLRNRVMYVFFAVY